jgi:acyl-CoA thioester hydrolase
MRPLRSDAVRRDTAWYPHHFELRTAYADVDPIGHLNNVALARFFQESRTVIDGEVWGLEQIVRPGGRTALLLAHVDIDYLQQGFWPGMLTVGTGVEHVGTSSYANCAALFQDTCIALCRSVTVHTLHGRPAPLPGEARRRLETFRPRSDP